MLYRAGPSAGSCGFVIYILIIYYYGQTILDDGVRRFKFTRGRGFSNTTYLFFLKRKEKEEEEEEEEEEGKG